MAYVPFGTKYFIDFLLSYKENRAGISHNLIVLFNGFTHDNELDQFYDVISKMDVTLEVILTTSKFDIDAYFYIAQNKIEYEYMMFLNTYSIILHNNWLKFYYCNLIIPSVGCVAATGAWGDFKHTDDYNGSKNSILKLKFDIRDLKKVIYYRFNFFPSVGVHLRTNAFMIKRSLFLTIKRPPVRPFILSLIFNLNAKKIKSFCFEHGSNSFSKQLLNRGYKILVVDKFGNGLHVNDWAHSNTYHNGSQENLLVQDNQTSKYQLSNSEDKKKLKYATWGIK